MLHSMNLGQRTEQGRDEHTKHASENRPDRGCGSEDLRCDAISDQNGCIDQRDLADIYWKEYTITSAYNITYAPYTANADFMLHLNLEPLIGVEYPIEEINEAFHAYATHRYQKILIHI